LIFVTFIGGTYISAPKLLNFGNLINFTPFKMTEIFFEKKGPLEMPISETHELPWTPQGLCP
jgi:hypothetical protein